MKTYKLSLSRTYVSKWQMPEAVRELIQNALDSESPFKYSFYQDLDDDSKPTKVWNLKLSSEFTTLSPQTLLLGTTSKAENESAIGSFGEGYKLALLVLTRLGYRVTMRNGDKFWQPRFEYDADFGDDLLVIRENTNPAKPKGLIITVHDLSEADVSLIRNSCLLMQDQVGEQIETPMGYILLDKPGQLYVGSLFICNTELDYGYNVHPRFMPLERDRKTVDNWNLRWAAKEMWMASGDLDRVAKLINDGCPDVEYVKYGSTQMVKEACYRVFRAKNPEAVVARDQAELDSLVKSGMTEVIIVKEAFYQQVSESKSYRQESPVREQETVQIILKRWFEANKKHMRQSAIEAFEFLLEESVKWKI